MKAIKVRNINDILTKDLSIPDYQRPYCWSKKSVRDLLKDLERTCKKCKKNSEYKYRIGTIILYYDGNEKNIYEIVDGQQRIITLSLIKYVFKKNYHNYLLDNSKFSSKKTINNIKENYMLIHNWYNRLTNKKEFVKIFNNNLELLVVKVEDIDEAFQLFDSQNSSGKELYPHDLLKAFHLREMEEGNEIINIQNRVKRWEEENSTNIANLFEHYLYPIKCWSNKENVQKFGVNNIDEYKGITNNITKNNSNYNYYQLFKKGKFQMNLPFFSGNDFFEMVNHYLDMIQTIIKEVEKHDTNIYMLITSYLYKDKYKTKYYESCTLKNTINRQSLGMKYTCQLFFAALMFYYDRFGKIDKTVLYKLFTWAFMLRIDLEMINTKSINIYALGHDNDKTTNHIPIFNLIANFKNHFDLYDLVIDINENPDNESWKELYDFIDKLEKDEEDNENE